jgi:uncharacterized protein YdaU (DUF1376 family)
MAEFPALPLWTDAYLGDTTHLTTFEHGAYLLLIMISWRSPGCCVPDNDALLARYSRMTIDKWRKTRPVLEPFFHIQEGHWHQRRLQDEFRLLQSRKSQQSEAGKASAKAKALKRQSRGSTTVGKPLQRTANEKSTSTPSNTSPNGEGAEAAPADVQKEAYDRGKALLIRTGTTPKAAGAIITKWVRQRDAQWVLEAVIAADDKAEPISWIEARMKAKASVEDEYRANAAATAARYRAADMGEPPEHVKRELGWVE